MRILVLDFDGVIHSYKSGWQGATTISDDPVPGALEFLAVATTEFEVHVLSSRSGEPGGIEAMKLWLWGHARRLPGYEDWIQKIKWPTIKPPAFLTIDDRAMCFKGTWPSIYELATFKPWHQNV